MRLPDVTLMIVDCIDAVGAAKVLDICQSKCEFGAVKLLTSQDIADPRKVVITPLNSLTAYSVFMLTRVHEYIDTSHVLIVQRDGWILNADAFDPAWLKLDYIAPLFMQYDKVGSGGFSMRSKRIMQHGVYVYGAWDGTEVDAERIQVRMGMYEDGVLSMSKDFANFAIASLEQGARFANGGNRNPKYFVDYPFGFHRTFSKIDFETGYVDSSDVNADIYTDYGQELDRIHKQIAK